MSGFLADRVLGAEVERLIQSAIQLDRLERLEVVLVEVLDDCLVGVVIVLGADQAEKALDHGLVAKAKTAAVTLVEDLVLKVRFGELREDLGAQCDDHLRVGEVDGGLGAEDGLELFAEESDGSEGELLREVRFAVLEVDKFCLLDEGVEQVRRGEEILALGHEVLDPENSLFEGVPELRVDEHLEKGVVFEFLGFVGAVFAEDFKQGFLAGLV